MRTGPGAVRSRARNGATHEGPATPLPVWLAPQRSRPSSQNPPEVWSDRTPPRGVLSRIGFLALLAMFRLTIPSCRHQ